MFCIVYALIGIPMTLLLLTAVVERLLIPVLYARLWMQNRFGHAHQPMVIYVVHFAMVNNIRRPLSHESLFLLGGEKIAGGPLEM